MSPAATTTCSARTSASPSILTAGACLALNAHASDELKDKYLPNMYAGIWAGSMCLTEPHAGTDLGIIRTKAEVKDGKVLGVTLENVPAFLYKPNQKVVIDGKEITFDISFGGSFFALVDTDKLGLVDEINEKTVPYLTQLGMKMMEKINKEIKIQHPRITSVDLIEFYGHNVSPDADKRNVVIFGEAQADRSPCGTGTSAKLGTLYAKGELKVGEPFIYESFMGTKFKGVIEKEVDECGYKAVIPLITGSAYLTGEATYAIDPTDPLKYGFIVG